MPRDTMTPLEWTVGDLAFSFDLAADAPVELASATYRGTPVLSRKTIVDVFVAGALHARAQLSYDRSMVGAGLRYVSHEADAEGALSIVQLDAATGAKVTTALRPTSGASVSVSSTVEATTEKLTVLAISSLSVATAHAAGSGRYELLRGSSEWLGEGDWAQTPLVEVLRPLRVDLTGQAGRGRYRHLSTGGWSTGTVLPTGALIDRDGPSIAWQIEVTAGWLWELSQLQDAVSLNALGPTDEEHQFAVTLEPGESFASVPAALAVGDGLAGAIAALTAHRRAIFARRPIDAALPLVYNDYMNTLNGQPSTEKLRPLIAAAAAAGAEYFCIDAGWFTDVVDYWGTIGVWEEAPTRFTAGLAALLDEVRQHGMVPGLWLEPEIIALDSPAVDLLPDDAFFQRYGHVTVEHHRRHLDLRHPAARRHLDETVDRLVAEFGVGFFKLDYNIEPGAGTDRTGSAGEGLLGHALAFGQWLRDAQERHPDVLFENCASGAMRMDYHLLSIAHLQSTSDQMNASRYATVAAVAPLSIAPEQAGNWAYPAAEMSDGELRLTMVNGLAGRLYLSGFLDRLSPAQRETVHRFTAAHKDIRHELAQATPFWPHGVPGWDDDILTLAYRTPTRGLLFVWTRGVGGELALPGDLASATPLVVDGPAWEVSQAGGGSVLRVPEGPDAAVFEFSAF